MGKTKKKSETLAVQLDSEGKIRYDALARQGHHKDRVVHSKFQQLVPKEILDESDPDLQRPDEDAIKEVKLCRRIEFVCVKENRLRRPARNRKLFDKLFFYFK